MARDRADEAIGWRFTKDPVSGQYDEMYTPENYDETIIAAGKFPRVARALISYTKKTGIPTYMLFWGSWYYILVDRDGSITVTRNRHEGFIEDDMKAMGIDKPFEEWNLGERSRYLEMRDKSDKRANVKLRQLGDFIRATGTKVEVLEDWTEGEESASKDWWIK